MKGKFYNLGFEFFLLFVAMPISFTIDYPLWIKAVFAFSGFIYIILSLKKAENISFKIKKKINWKAFVKRTAIRFLIISLLTTSYVWFTQPEALFHVPQTKPLLFMSILFVYSVFSVWPQEIIYRTFFFERYHMLFKSKSLLIFINAVVFSLAHLFFRNTLVLVLTFLGGIIFGMTYLKFRSTTLVTIEHALYGNWLFTVGMGEMLAFPGYEA